jgi:peptidoglycan L-alanyl-D-glutamate endopeptidase CwlK
MKGWVFDERSKKKLKGVHPDLVAVIERALEISGLDFIVTEGLRTAERQKELYNSGASRTMNSRHLTGHAVDLAVKVGDEIRWDWPLYHRLAKYVMEAAYELKIDVEWGGDWVSFKDGPHYQLSKKKYPV